MKLKSINSLKNKAENLWKEVCYRRDGRVCKVRQHFPEIEISHTDVYQVDHCITRGNKLLVYDVRNGTVVCSSCNSAKSNNMKSVMRAIDKIVIAREGREAFDQMVAIDMAKSVNPDYSKRWWLEAEIEKLEALLK